MLGKLCLVYFQWLQLLDNAPICNVVGAEDHLPESAESSPFSDGNWEFGCLALKM